MQTVAGPYNHGQGYAVMMVERHFPAVAVAEVFEDEFFRIELFLLVVSYLFGFVHGLAGNLVHIGGRVVVGHGHGGHQHGGEQQRQY